ncbi:MAG TPA: aldo/keto reductase [Vitreimonas sp.]|uniref:aldo/keto reductase n=1 Tax=Vitreimonas sp. TaxID=3069702 RepID=UPI002D43FF2B|nr:aldo/keto reductase [Vitreimonas sp.]HYD88636.1 aldo/keto reductase [Vitreimonas sp.]
MQQKRELGQSGLAIAPLMLGGNVFGWTADERVSHAVLDAFVDMGGDAIDTADVYSNWAPGHAGGESERVIGSWLKASGKRERVVIATKVGMWDKRLGIRRENILAACDDSLSRLGVEAIDLYQLHRDDKETPPEEFVGALKALHQGGKVRAVGLSNFEPARLEAAIAEGKRQGLPIATLQPEYNLMNRAIEAELMPICVREKVSLIPFYGLASGYLTGKYRTEADKAKSLRGGRMDKYMQGKGPTVLAALDEVSARHGATPAQVALAWIMAKPAVAAPIASATSVEQLRELLGALRLELSGDDVAALDRASA